MLLLINKHNGYFLGNFRKKLSYFLFNHHTGHTSSSRNQKVARRMEKVAPADHDFMSAKSHFKNPSILLNGRDLLFASFFLALLLIAASLFKTAVSLYILHK